LYFLATFSEDLHAQAYAKDWDVVYGCRPEFLDPARFVQASHRFRK
jgi:hypothetical protein